MDDEPRALLERSRERLAVANDLLRLGHWEDAANRAYFAIFSAARAMLLIRGVETKTHRGVASEFGRALVLPKLVPAEMGRVLREAREIREEADYGSIVRTSEAEARDLVDEARGFVETAATFLSSS